MISSPSAWDLVASELRRLVGRPLLRWSLVLAMSAIVAAGVGVFVRTSGSQESAELQARRVVAECERQASATPRDGARGGCPSIKSILPVVHEGLRFASSIPKALREIGSGLLLMAFALGASLGGAEWSSRVVATTLTWEPRRSRLLAARVTMVGFVLMAASVAVLGLVVGVLLPAAHWHGTLDGANVSWWMQIVTGSIVIGVTVGIVGSVGASLANALRSTAGGIAAGAGYIVLEPVLVFVGGDSLRPWLVRENVMRLVDEVSVSPLGIQPPRELDFVQAVAVVSVCALVSFLVARESFERRDVVA